MPITQDRLYRVAASGRLWMEYCDRVQSLLEQLSNSLATNQITPQEAAVELQQIPLLLKQPHYSTRLIIEREIHHYKQNKRQNDINRVKIALRQGTTLNPKDKPILDWIGLRAAVSQDLSISQLGLSTNDDWSTSAPKPNLKPTPIQTPQQAFNSAASKIEIDPDVTINPPSPDEELDLA